MTHAFRRAHLAWLKARSTSIAVQRKMMRPADVRTTMKIYRDVATKKMSAAGIKVAPIAFQNIGPQQEQFVCFWLLR
jgi:integrase